MIPDSPFYADPSHDNARGQIGGLAPEPDDHELCVICKEPVTQRVIPTSSALITQKGVTWTDKEAWHNLCAEGHAEELAEELEAVNG